MAPILPVPCDVRIDAVQAVVADMPIRQVEEQSLDNVSEEAGRNRTEFVNEKS